MLKLLRRKAEKESASSASESTDDSVVDEPTENQNQDEAMSQTLTQALDMLDQDFEDQGSASQMINQTEVAQAFLAQKKPD